MPVTAPPLPVDGDLVAGAHYELVTDHQIVDRDLHLNSVCAATLFLGAQLEAMKMENPVTAHRDGTGGSVRQGAVLCEIKDAE